MINSSIAVKRNECEHLTGKESGRYKHQGISVFSSEYKNCFRYVYSVKGQVVAALQICYDSLNFGLMTNIYVSQELQRKGIATKLYQRALKDFDRLGLTWKPEAPVLQWGVKMKDNMTVGHMRN
jgi:predicted GNAT family acetyltransferase